MLISRVEDDKAAEGRQASDSHEYQTASELFDLMAKDHPFEHVSETLSTQDLVILYENIDLGTKLMSSSGGYNLNRKPNQRVESVVHNDDRDSEDSETSEIYNTEDLYNVFSINKERIDMLNTQPSFQNTLCQKLGDLEIQASNLSLQYNQHFLFKDPYIKEQLNQFDGEFDGSTLPASLLDYICCKRLEDNYNFYMDNIIRYVKHTIEQLKRISNGDYLTDKAKEKWKEVKDAKEDDAKVLATSTSIPLQVERKVSGLSTTWDDIIHSEVDVRSLSKILEKRIILEVPKLICGSYKLFSKLCSNNLIISCKRKPQVTSEKKEARVDVVLQLSRSETGQVMSKISSIMILQPTPPVLPVECPKVPPLPCTENEEEKVSNKKVKIIEIPEVQEESTEGSLEVYSDVAGEEIYDDASVPEYMDDDVNFFNESKTNSIFESGDSSVGLNLKNSSEPRGSDSLQKETSCSFLPSDEYSISMHKLNMSSLPEEVSEDMLVNPVYKKRSSTKVRIKSPYENKSHMIEEKKRKKLLEIRERREKRKMAAGESCKISKHKYGKGPVMPQPASSVTNLSITNKSFYNSIYGQNIIMEKQPSKSKGRGRKGSVLDMPLNQSEGDLDSPLLTPDKCNKKYINRSYYLDEAVTEMMYTDNKNSDCSSVRNLFSGCASALSGDFTANINIINQIIKSPPSDTSRRLNSPNCKTDCLDEKKDFSDLNEDDLDDTRIKVVASSRNLLAVPVPSNSPKEEEEDIDDSKKALQTVECRKSIDKLYELMKKIRRIDTLELKSSRSKLLANSNKIDTDQDSPMVPGSDSGTSLKHHLTSSSSFSFHKTNCADENNSMKFANNKATDAPTSVVPKVIISTKQQTEKFEVERRRKERKKVVVNPPVKDPENPLKAISHLLHEFESVQKTRHKTSTESKPNRRPDIPVESRNISRQESFRRRSRGDQPVKEGNKQMKEQETNDSKNVKVLITKERRLRSNPAMDTLKVPHQQTVEEKQTDRVTRKKIADIIDEVREAKGEAVRGPSKQTSRLNTLAQPKKSYVQAHSEEYQTKYGKTLMADRLQRLAAAARARPRRVGPEALSAVSVSSPQPLGKTKWWL